MNIKSLKFLRIKKRRDFVDIQTNFEHKENSKNFIILLKNTSDFYLNKNLNVNPCRIGIVATKKIDNRAVIRNKIKRIIRELITTNSKNNKNIFLKNFDYEIIAKKTFLENSFSNLNIEFVNLLKNIVGIYGK